MIIEQNGIWLLSSPSEWKAALKLANVNRIVTKWVARWMWWWTRTHPGTAAEPDLSDTLQNIPPPFPASTLNAATTSDQSIDPCRSRSVGTLWSGPAQLLEWVIVISSCLDQLGLIRAERLWTRAEGTADYSHQWQICETIQGLLRLLQTNCFILAPVRANLWAAGLKMACGYASVEMFPQKMQKETNTHAQCWQINHTVSVLKSEPVPLVWHCTDH